MFTGGREDRHYQIVPWPMQWLHRLFDLVVHTLCRISKPRCNDTVFQPLYRWLRSPNTLLGAYVCVYLHGAPHGIHSDMLYCVQQFFLWGSNTSLIVGVQKDAYTWEKCVLFCVYLAVKSFYHLKNVKIQGVTEDHNGRRDGKKKWKEVNRCMLYDISAG